MPLSDKTHTLGDQAIEQLRAAVRWIQQQVDRLSAEPRSHGRQVTPLDRMVYVDADVEPGEEAEVHLLADDGETGTETLTVKNWYRNTTVLGLTVWWVGWYRGGWRFKTGECPPDS